MPSTLLLHRHRYTSSPTAADEPVSATDPVPSDEVLKPTAAADATPNKRATPKAVAKFAVMNCHCFATDIVLPYLGMAIALPALLPLAFQVGCILSVPRFLFLFRADSLRCRLAAPHPPSSCMFSAPSSFFSSFFAPDFYF
jgi:hypothetical protein